jgi:hypothetical protein
VLRHIGEPDWLARQPQHYFLAPGSYTNGIGRHQLPCTLETNQSREFTILAVPTADGWRGSGRLRVQMDSFDGRPEFAARLNDVDLHPTGNTEEPFGCPYRARTGRPEALRAWTVPAGALHKGRNVVTLSLSGPARVELLYLDLALPDLGCP